MTAVAATTAEDQGCTHCSLPLPRRLRDGVRGAPAFCCLGCRIAHDLARPALSPAEATGPGGTLLVRTGLGIFLTMNLMAFSGPFYAQEAFGDGAAPYSPGDALLAYLLLLLATAVVAALGIPLLAASLLGGGRLRDRIGADLLIIIGVGAAYALSAMHTIAGAGRLYFDTAGTILVLVTLGRYLEATARRRAAAAAVELLARTPDRAFRAVAGSDGIEEVDADTLVAGNRVRVRPGETVPADGVVLEGLSLLDQASLTGESRPRAVRPFDTVLAGTLALDGQLWIEVRAAAGDRVVARLRQALEEARRRQPPIQRLADQVARIFVPTVLLLAIAVLAWHAAEGNAARGLLDGLSVLLISCPCALGLAAPLATWMALTRLTRLGVLVDSAETLDRAARVDRIFLDKTGTLTGPDLTLMAVDPEPGITAAEALGLAAAVEATSLHPVARALVAAARSQGLVIRTATAGRALPGLGVEAEVEGRRLSLGSETLAARQGATASDTDSEDRAAAVLVFLLEGNRCLARFTLAERLRDDAQATIAALRDLGVEATILTGDGPGPAARAGQALGLHHEASLLPGDKLAALGRARESRPRGRIAMVGDGLNDAPVLAAADVGFALGNATDLARRAGNVQILGDRLLRVPQTLAVARATLRSVRRNLLWAFGYNSIGVTLAALGLLTPIFAASAMLFSSLWVVRSARRAGTTEFAAALASDSSASRPPA